MKGPTRVVSAFHRVSFEIIRYELRTRICKGGEVSLLDEGIYQFLPRA